MPCCGGCSSSVQEPAKGLLELSLLEAGEYSLFIGFRAPPKAFLVAPRTSWWVYFFPQQQQEVDFVVSIIGGPNSDLLGPRQERICSQSGQLITHEVSGLLPDTFYTIQVITEHRSHLSSVTETIEARTSAATTAQFAEEDWGRNACMHGECKDKTKKGTHATLDEKETTSSTSSSSSSSTSPMATGVQDLSSRWAHVARDDSSTIAPSDVGDVGDEEGAADERAEEAWEVESECVQAALMANDTFREGSTDVVVHEAVVELEEATSLSDAAQCNLCSLMDCLRLVRQQKPIRRPDPSELVVNPTVEPQGSPVVAATSTPSTSTRVRRPYRLPFPGMPVDPATVGLELLPHLNASVLTALLDGRRNRSVDESSPTRSAHVA